MNENFDFWKWLGDRVQDVRNNFAASRAPQKIISPIPESTPTPTPDPWVEKGFTKAGGGYYKVDDKSKSYIDKDKIPSDVIKNIDAQYEAKIGQKPTPVPSNSMLNDFGDFNQYRVSGNYEIPKMPDEIAEQVKETFGKEAGRAAIVAGTENGRYDPTATNDNGGGRGVDLGIFQINSNTFNDFMRRKGKQFHAIGVDSFEDLQDPVKNIKAAKIIYDEQGWNAWYGPRNRGYNVYD